MARRKRRTRAERARRKRERAAAEVESMAIVPKTEQSPAQTEGVRGMLRDAGHLRSDLRLLNRYMGAGQFTPDEITDMVQKVGRIVVTGDNRESVAAFKALLAQARLSFEIDKHSEPARHQHAHLHRQVESEVDVFDIARSLGIELRVIEE